MKLTDNTAIRIENLSKKYTIGKTNQSYQFKYGSLRDSFVDWLKRIPSFFTKSGEERITSENKIWALENISFDVKKGEVIGIIGSNGAGKSTLLKILSRITEPTSGDAYIYGRVGSLLEVGTGFHPELTGRENIFLNGVILGMSRQEIGDQFEEIVNFAELEKFVDTPVKHYSSGMYLRLAFSVAAHLNPEILIIDEVLAVGDLAFQKKCLGKMDSISKEGRTILFVSHDMRAIQRLCQRVLWIEKGKLLKSGLPREVIQEYELESIGKLNESSFLGKKNRKINHTNSFYIKSIEMSNRFGDVTNRLTYGDNLMLNVEFSDKNASTLFSPEFYIYNQLGIKVAVGAYYPYHGRYFDPEIKEVSINIGPLFLTSGNYSITLSVMVGNERVDTWEEAIYFNIDECKPFATSWNMPQEVEGVCIIQHNFKRKE